MTEPPTWPPPPTTPNLLAAHDEFLSACVRNSTLKPPVSRLRLVRDLHQNTGQDLRSCLAVVNSFCDRHTILMPLTGIQVWLLPALCGLNFVIVLAMNITGHFLGRSAASAVTHSQRSAFLSQRVDLDYALMAVLFVYAAAAIIMSWLRQKKARADAAEAVAKFGGAG